MLLAVGLWVIEAWAALAACRAWGISRRTELVAATSLVWIALVTVPIYALALTGTLYPWTVASASLGGSLALLWLAHRTAGPVARDAYHGALSIARLPYDGLAMCVRARSPATVGLLLVAVAVGYNALAAYFAPSWRTWDSLWYHEPIIGFSIQNHGFSPVDLPVATVQKINGYPRLTEMIGLSFAIFGGRRLIDLPNILLMPMLVCSTYAAARRRGADELTCVAWSAVVPMIPANLELLQTQINDPAMTAMIAAAFCFASSRPLSRRDVLLAAFAAAAAANTKFSGVTVAFLIGIVLAVRVLANRSSRAQDRAITFAAGTVILLVFPAATYVRNLLLFHNPLWPDLKLDAPALGIHWPGMGEFGGGNEKVDMNIPIAALIDELTTQPFGVNVREQHWIFQYGPGVSWIVIPAIAVGVLVAGLKLAQGLWLARFRPWRLDLELLELDSFAALVVAFLCATSTALWSPRYNMPAIAVGGVLLCLLFADRRWSAFHQAVAFTAVTTAVMLAWWDHPTWRSFPMPSQLVALARTPYPARELTPELGSPAKLDVGLARERDLHPGSLVLTDDFVFLGLLWNNDYSNRVVTVRGSTNMLDAAAKLRPDWIYLSGREGWLKQLLATGEWEELGPLYVEGWGTALHRRTSTARQ